LGGGGGGGGGGGITASPHPHVGDSCVDGQTEFVLTAFFCADTAVGVGCLFFVPTALTKSRWHINISRSDVKLYFYPVYLRPILQKRLDNHIQHHSLSRLDCSLY
jgi:hypothetical protein